MLILAEKKKKEFLLLKETKQKQNCSVESLKLRLPSKEILNKPSKARGLTLSRVNASVRESYGHTVVGHLNLSINYKVYCT